MTVTNGPSVSLVVFLIFIFFIDEGDPVIIAILSDLKK